MPRGVKRNSDAYVYGVMLENQGHGFRFNELYKEFVKRGVILNQSTVSSSLKFLIEQKKVAKFKGVPRNYYGVPLTRKDGSKYLCINQGLKDEEVTVA